RPVGRLIPPRWPRASFPTYHWRVRESSHLFLPPAFPLRADGHPHISKSAASFLLAGERWKIAHASQLQCIHHFNDRSEGSFLVSLQGQRCFLGRRKTADGILKFTNIDGIPVQFHRVD